MDRRAFLSLSASACVAAAYPGFAGGGGFARVRKALKLGMIAGEGSLASKFAIAHAAGFAGVELDSPSGLTADEVADAKAATGIRVPGVIDSQHWSKPLNDADESVREQGVAALEQAVRDAAAWCDREAGDRPTVLLVPAVVGAQRPYAEAYDLAVRGIARVLPLAAELEVRIAIENVWNNFLLSPIEARRFVDELNALADADVVGWYLDIGNLWGYGWPVHWIETLGERIVRLDVKGYSRAIADERGKWAGFGVEIGEGDIDWPAVRSSLAQIVYTGWASAEVAGGDVERLRRVAGQIDAVLNS